MIDATGILNFQRLDARITTSGQPDEGQLAGIAALGVRHVINLALHSHERALPDEGASVAALGMTYTHIPVAFDAPAETDYAAFVAALAAIGNDPVHIHCIVNARVSAFFYRWQRGAGTNEGTARATMARVWQPGGVWAAFIGDTAATGQPHRFAGQDY